MPSICEIIALHNIIATIFFVDTEIKSNKYSYELVLFLPHKFQNQQYFRNEN